MKIIHFSDTHLGFTMYSQLQLGGENTRERDFYNALKEVVNYAIDQKVDYVIHTGDFFHRPSPTNRAISEAIEQLQRLSLAGIHTIVIAGNHSTPKTIWTSPILKVFEPLANIYPIYQQKYEKVVFNNIVFHGLPHINSLEDWHKEIEKLAPVDGKINILLMHTSLGKPYMEDLYGDTLFPPKYYPIIDSFDYIALGHWHNMQKVSQLKNAWYSGSTERLSESEINHPKGFLMLDTAQISNPEFITLPTRPWFRWKISNCADMSEEEIINQIERFANESDTRGAIISLYLENLKVEQSLELQSHKIEKILDSALELEIHRSYLRQSNQVQSENVNASNIKQMLTEYIGQEVTQEELKDWMKEKLKDYFSGLEG